MLDHFLAMLSVLAAQPVTPPAEPVLPSVPAAMPADILAAFADTETALATVSGCVGNGSVMTPQRLATLDRRLMALRRQANGVWGPEALATLPAATAAGDCERGGGAAALASAAELQLTQLATKLGVVLTPMRSGVWIGTMPLCGRGFLRADLSADVYSAEPILLITLDPALASELADLSSHHIGNMLALRAGGHVVAEPVFYEPVTAGQLQLVGPSQAELERAASAVKNCAKSNP